MKILPNKLIIDLLDSALKNKTRNQKLKSYYKKLAQENKSSVILETSFESRVKELKDQLAVLEVEKLEVEHHLNVFLEREVVTKENGRYTDDVRAVYQDLVCMGVGVNNVEKVVRTVLTNVGKVNVDQLPKAS